MGHKIFKPYVFREFAGVTMVKALKLSKAAIFCVVKQSNTVQPASCDFTGITWDNTHESAQKT